MTVEALRKVIYSALRIQETLMGKGYLERSAARVNRIAKIRAQFDYLEGKSLNVHFRVLLKLNSDVRELIPATTSRYKDFRVRMILMMDEAEHSINGDQLRIIVR